MNLNDKKKALLIVGCGKMGLSHLVLFTPYLGKKNLIVVEKKFFMRLVLLILGYKTLSKLPKNLDKFTNLTGVLVATPTKYHYEIADWAISNGLSVFVEKPLTLNTDLSRDLMLKASKAKVYSQVGFVMRFTPSFIDLKAIIESNKLGKVKKYSASMNGYVITPKTSPDSWQSNYKLGGGCLNEFGPHLLDLCRFLFGNVNDATKVKMGKIFSINADDWLTCALHHDDNLSGNIELNWSDETTRKSVVKLTVEFENATLYADSSGVSVLNSSSEINLKDIIQSVSGEKYNVDFYLRGEEFSLQAEAFMHNAGFSIKAKPSHTRNLSGSLSDGLIVDELINKISLDLDY